MAKLAVEVERALERRAISGDPGDLAARVLAHGDGWTVQDMVCTAGPDDRPFEEQHSRICIAIVVAGSFQYRSGPDDELMTPGSLLLGSAGQGFECAHEHGAGDRCLSFQYASDYFERIAADTGAREVASKFQFLRVPPLRALAPVTTKACAALVTPTATLDCGAARPSRKANVLWEEIGVELAAQTVQLVAGLSGDPNSPPHSATARVARTVRMIERHPSTRWALGRLADTADLSPYHFLRTFERVAGVTPHQYILRSRLREAAMRLVLDQDRVLDIALDCGFGDVSNFNHAFRAEFGVPPRAYRLRHA